MAMEIRCGTLASQGANRVAGNLMSKPRTVYLALSRQGIIAANVYLLCSCINRASLIYRFCRSITTTQMIDGECLARQFANRCPRESKRSKKCEVLTAIHAHLPAMSTALINFLSYDEVTELGP